jgi:phosphoglycolate phosphatase
MVADLLGKLDARPALVVGDRQDDVVAAHANGLQAVAARYGYGTLAELAEADATAFSAGELPALVRRLLDSAGS